LKLFFCGTLSKFEFLAFFHLGFGINCPGKPGSTGDIGGGGSSGGAAKFCNLHISVRDASQTVKTL